MPGDPWLFLRRPAFSRLNFAGEISFVEEGVELAEEEVEDVEFPLDVCPFPVLFPVPLLLCPGG